MNTKLTKEQTNPICDTCGKNKTKYFVLFLNTYMWSCTACSIKVAK